MTSPIRRLAADLIDHVVKFGIKDGWGGRIRTYDTRYQKPMPYHLATPHQYSAHKIPVFNKVPVALYMPAMKASR